MKHFFRTESGPCFLPPPPLLLRLERWFRSVAGLLPAEEAPLTVAPPLSVVVCVEATSALPILPLMVMLESKLSCSIDLECSQFMEHTLWTRKNLLIGISNTGLLIRSAMTFCRLEFGNSDVSLIQLGQLQILQNWQAVLTAWWSF